MASSMDISTFNSTRNETGMVHGSSNIFITMVSSLLAGIVLVIVLTVYCLIHKQRRVPSQSKTCVASAHTEQVFSAFPDSGYDVAPRTRARSESEDKPPVPHGRPTPCLDATSQQTASAPAADTPRDLLEVR